MDLNELEKTALYELYEKGRNYMRMRNVFTDTDRNYRMYNGNQWYGAKIEGIEQAQYNFSISPWKERLECHLSALQQVEGEELFDKNGNPL